MARVRPGTWPHASICSYRIRLLAQAHKRSIETRHCRSMKFGTESALARNAIDYRRRALCFFAPKQTARDHVCATEPFFRLRGQMSAAFVYVTLHKASVNGTCLRNKLHWNLSRNAALLAPQLTSVFIASLFQESRS